MSDHSVLVGDERLAAQLEYLRSLGTAEVAHTEHDFLRHLRSVRDLLAAHGAEPHVVDAGLFHSIYGTEGFQDFSLPLSERGRVRGLIGVRAERLAFWHCAMDRSSYDAALERAAAGAASVEFRDRVGSAPLALTLSELRDLAQLHLFDWLEQVERSPFGWGYRRSAYRRMAELAGSEAVSLYEEVFAREPLGAEG